MQRRLAAIMVADVVGYSRLMASDEDKTHHVLKRYLESTFKPAVVSHGGRVVKTMGDGILVEFPSAIGAVNCALAIQHERENRTAEENSSREPDLLLRIGIDIGDIIVDGEDIFGTGVNVATRLEALAQSGGICISSSVKESLSHEIQAKFADRGELKVKNIDRPMRVWSSVSEKSARLKGEDPAAGQITDKPTIAVLPFDNMSGRTEEDYFSEGLSEDIITELSKFHSISVLARHSSFAFKGKSLTATEIGEKLGADFIVEGSVRKIANRMRLVVQLVESESAKHVWADSFDESLDQILEVEDQIIKKVVGMLEINLLHERLSAFKKRESIGARPYDLWLKARKSMEEWTPEADERAQIILEECISLDPQFAKAHGALAGIYNSKNLISPGIDKNDFFLGQGFYHAKCAVELDPNDGRNHVDLAWSYMLSRQFRRGKKHFDLAVKLNPNDASILIACALGAAFLGDPDSGRDLAQQATELNPLHPDYYLGNLAIIHFLNGNYSAVLDTIESAPHALPEIGAWRAAALAMLDKTEDAKLVASEFRESIKREWRGSKPMTDLALQEWLLSINSFAKPEDRKRFIDGLRKAGIGDED